MLLMILLNHYTIKLLTLDTHLLPPTNIIYRLHLTLNMHVPSHIHVKEMCNLN